MYCIVLFQLCLFNFEILHVCDYLVCIPEVFVRVEDTVMTDNALALLSQPSLSRTALPIKCTLYSRILRT